MRRQFLSSHLLLAEGSGVRRVARRVAGAAGHPWQVRAVWVEEVRAWCVTCRPGFVNGIDPVARGAAGWDKRVAFVDSVVASDRAAVGGGAAEVGGGVEPEREIFGPVRREDVPLLQGPLVPVAFGVRWPGPAGMPLAISNLGVPRRAATGGLSVSAAGNVSVNLTEAEREAQELAGKRRAVTGDVMLAQPRAGLRERVDVQDATGISGRVVSYSSEYDLSVIERTGGRPFVYAVPDASELLNRRKAGFLDRLRGAAADDMLDKVHVARVWAISPPGDEESQVPGPDWQVEVEQKTFWNLTWRSRAVDPRVPREPVRFPVALGIGGGVGGGVINQFLALTDDLQQRIERASDAAQPEGRFWG